MSAFVSFLKQRYLLVFSVFVAFVFLQSLFFKGAELIGEPADITVYIFQTIGDWIAGLGLPALGDAFGQYGGLVIGAAELVASVLILRPQTRAYGAVLGLAVISGAIFFHVFTPLGLYPYTDLQCLVEGCPREYALFYMALGVWFSCVAIIYQSRKQLLALLGR